MGNTLPKITMIRKDFVEKEKVPSLTKLAHVAVLKLIDQISKINQFPEFKERVLSLPKDLLDELFNVAFYNKMIEHSSCNKIEKKMNFYPEDLLTSLRGFQGKELCKSVSGIRRDTFLSNVL